MNQVETNQQTESTSSKAGRHRLYSNEQRKDRNRQAQAAFRDRRSKYTKTLETAILKFEDTIERLKEANTKSNERAQIAQDRCAELEAEVNSLQKLVQMTLTENQRLLQQQNSSSSKF
jgi:predicted RNase H-like nuclease (RuvC/YqgF family)